MANDLQRKPSVNVPGRVTPCKLVFWDVMPCLSDRIPNSVLQEHFGVVPKTFGCLPAHVAGPLPANLRICSLGQPIEPLAWVEATWNVMAHAQKPDFVFRRNGRVHLNRRGRQFSRLPAAEVCASAVVMLDAPCSEVVWRVLATHSIRQFPPHFPSRASPCAIAFQLQSPLRVTAILNSKTKEYLIFFSYPILCDWMSWHMSRFRTSRFCDVSFWYT
jgi:hypothetical protein